MVAAPGIVMVARSTEAVAHVFGTAAVLGRTIKTDNGMTCEIADDRMSREHATVRFERGHWVITDLASRNGTFVNTQRITGEVRRRGDTILRCGHSVFVLLADATGHPAALTDDVGPELARCDDQIRRSATSPVLLLSGEVGAGKERAARLYHEVGPHRGGPFVAVSCATMPEGVADRLLFGARKGIVESIGHFQMARGGTIFLDEIHTIGSTAQAKLARTLERRTIEPVGALAASPIDVGIVFGADAELKLAVVNGRFDAELHKRITETTVQLPSLRERRVDIARLVRHEVAATAPELLVQAKLVEACLVRPWPRNVPELQAAVRKAAMAALAQNRDLVRVEDLDPDAGLTAGALAAETAVERPKGDTPPAELDKRAVETALLRAQGALHLAARILGIHRTQLCQLMDKHGLVFTEEP